MYSRTHPPSSAAFGLRRMPSGTVSAGTPPPSIISALSTDHFAPQRQKKRHSVSAVEMPKLSNGTLDPWAGAFTKTFMHEAKHRLGDDDNRPPLARPYPLACRLVAEFVGTLIFVFISIIFVPPAEMDGILSAVPANHSDNAPLLNVAFGHGFAIFVVISTLGHVSGAHLNPAVSLGITLSGKMSPFLMPFYWCAQICGGFCAALLVTIVTSQSQLRSISAGATIVPSNTNLWQALSVEALLSAVLVLCVLSCAVDGPQNALAPLAIGMTISVSILSGASISGASFNPARSFGPCLVASLFIGEGAGSIGTKLSDPIWSSHFVYWAGPFVGAALSAFLYRFFFARGANCLLNR